MRLNAMEPIWIRWGGKWYAGHFQGYAGAGMVRTVSDLGNSFKVPRACVKPRSKKGAAA